MSVSIYRIYSDKGELQYYGSTKKTLNERFTMHKKKYKYNVNRCTSIKLFQEYGVENCYIELLEEVTEELRNEREGYYIKTFECVNKLILGRTQAEYYKQNKVKKAEYQKAHYEQNKEKNAEYHKEYREQNKEKNAEYKKAYYEQNKEKIKEKTKAYREQNKEKQAEYKKRYREKQKKSSNNIDNAEEDEKTDTEI